jgi:hypothetical protein
MRKVALKLLTLCIVFCSAFCGFTACSNTQGKPEDTRDSQILSIYNSYVAYAQDIGETPLSYEEWIASIQGEDGKDGQDGKTPQLRINEEKYWEVSYDDGQTWESLGVKAIVDSEEPKNYTEGLLYIENAEGTGYEVRGFGSADTRNVVIPSTHKGLPVTGIAARAFKDEDLITSITIPDSVTGIGQGAFSGCDSLTSAIFANTTGWKAGSTSISSSSLANKSTAATCLTRSYEDCSWTRS